MLLTVSALGQPEVRVPRVRGQEIFKDQLPASHLLQL